MRPPGLRPLLRLPGAAAGPPRASVGVLCAPRDAGAMGAAVGAGLAREHGARVVLVCTWGAGARPPGPGLPAAPAARRLARSLEARGLHASAAGRRVHVGVRDGAEAGRALAAAPGPAVLVVAGPRDARMDGLLRSQDHVVVADAGQDGVAALAEARLAADGVSVARRPVPSGAARRLAALGARMPAALRAERGQASVLVLALLLALALGAVLLGAIAGGVGAADERGRAADLSALAGARAMHDDFERLFEPATLGGRPNPRRLAPAAYLERARGAAVATARRNGFADVRVAFPDQDSGAPVRIRVTVRDPVVAGGAELPVSRTAEAELAPPAAATVNASVGAGEYRGPLEMRQGKGMRPDVARAFDRMEAAARTDGVALTITSAWRSNSEQAILFARHPDPKWVAPPGRSLHRLGTELDLGPPAAYAWLAANATRFGFTQRYSWEPWHYGYVRDPGTTSVGFGGGDGEATATLQSFVPARFAPAIARAAQRWSVSGALLAAQLYAESRFDPFGKVPGRRAGDRAVHARDGAGLRARRPVRRRARDRRAGASHARPPPAVRSGAARARGVQRRVGRRRALRVHPALSGDPRLRRAHPRAAQRRGRPRAGGRGARGAAGAVRWAGPLSPPELRAAAGGGAGAAAI